MSMVVIMIKTEQCDPYGERIRDERTANSRGAQIETLGRGKILEAEERLVVPSRSRRST